MCGLAGIINPNPLPDGKAVMQKMIDAMHHRGPDQDGVFVEGRQRVLLGHKRLSIIDLSAGRQPMTDADGLLTIVFNGEIYNHHDIKADLIGRGHPIRSRSDTETLLYAYKEYGPACLDKLRGMFAFAIFDGRDNSVFIARDRLGIKPLYYGTCGGTFLFASECKGILQFPGFSREMDFEALSDYFSFMYVPAPKSIFKQIRKLPAGHWMRVRADGATEIRKYWDVEFSDRGEYDSAKDFARAEEDLLRELDGAVASHMESDVPLGAFLSGGVDSAVVAALMSKHSTRAIRTNTIGFSEKDFDESEQAAQTAKFLKTDHHQFKVSPDAVNVMASLAWYYDEPFADSSMIPTFYVCEMARRNVTVALSGDGGDESFAGYRRYYFDRLENRVRSVLPAPLRVPVFGALGAIYPKADWLPQRFRAKTLFQNLAKPPMNGYFRSLTHFHPEMKSELFTSELRRTLGGYESISVFESHWKNCSSADPLSRVQYLDFKTYLADDILVKADRASMANSLELRVPLLDHKIVELAARMPSRWKLNGKIGKYIFKKSVEKILPPEIFQRKKTGFSIPMHAWFRKELKGFAQDHLFGESSRPLSAYLDQGYVKRLWDQHQSGVRNHGFPLFALLSFSLWHAKHIARK